MRNIDAIILSNTKDLSLYGLTQRTINSLRNSEEDYCFDIKIVETNIKFLEESFIYHDCDVITPGEKFNYNKFLNIGLSHCSNEWIVICNNDLIFTEKWFSCMMNFQKLNPYIKSLSPFEPIWHTERGLSSKQESYTGYRIGLELTGWCLVIHRDIIYKCNLFDERFSFWYQDNDYAETIKHHHFLHALVCNSRVYHVGSVSHHLLEDVSDQTHGQRDIFKNKWNF